MPPIHHPSIAFRALGAHIVKMPLQMRPPISTSLRNPRKPWNLKRHDYQLHTPRKDAPLAPPAPPVPDPPGFRDLSGAGARSAILSNHEESLPVSGLRPDCVRSGEI